MRPFFDVGFAGGQDQFSYPGGAASHNLAGMVLGGGVAVRLGRRWYICPQYRIHMLSGLHIVDGGGVGIGFRF